MEHRWWAEKPVLEINVSGGIHNRDQAFQLAKMMVDQIEGSGYPHVVVILDLSALGQSPSAAALLGGALPETLKIEHLVMVNAPFLLKIATAPIPQLRGKIHFADNLAAATTKATQLLPNLPA